MMKFVLFFSFLVQFNPLAAADSISIEQEIEWNQTSNNRLPMTNRLGFMPLQGQLVPLEGDARIKVKFIERNGGLSELQKRFLFVEQDGKRYLRVPFIDRPGVPARELSQKINRPAPNLLAALYPSHNTILAYNPETSEKIYFKMKRTDDLRGVSNDWEALSSSVVNSNLLEPVAQDPESDFDILPEVFAASIKIGRLEYSFLARSYSPVKALKKNEFLLPAHVILGNKSPVYKWIKGNPELWFDNFLTDWAEYLAHLHYHHGFYFADHNQNLMAAINTKTGKLVRFVNRDLFDFLEDPFIRRKNGKPSMASQAPGNYSVHQLFKSFVEGANEPTPGRLYSSYTSQVFDALRGRTSSVGYYYDIHKFFNAYIGQIKRDLGIDASEAVFHGQSNPSFDQFFRMVGSESYVLDDIREEVGKALRKKRGCKSDLTQ